MIRFNPSSSNWVHGCHQAPAVVRTHTRTVSGQNSHPPLKYEGPHIKWSTNLRPGISTIESTNRALFIRYFLPKWHKLQLNAIVFVLCINMAILISIRLRKLLVFHKVQFAKYSTRRLHLNLLVVFCLVKKTLLRYIPLNKSTI
jgi:hypothetical protein